MAEFYIKQNDTRPSLSATLAEDGAAVDLTGCTVMFHMGERVDAAAVVVDAETGIVRYDWAVADTAVAGCYPAEFEVTFSDGAIETFPNDDYITIIIQQDLT